MRIPLLSRKKSPEASEPTTCYHPLAMQRAIFDDPNDSARRTGIRCEACGQRIKDL